MSDMAVISIVMGGFGVLTWLLGLSYFLGRNTAKLDGLAEAFGEMKDTIAQIFEKLDALTTSLPHRCRQIQAISEIQAQIKINTKRIDELELWRHSFERTTVRERQED